MKRTLAFCFAVSLLVFTPRIVGSSSNPALTIKGGIFGHSHPDSNVCLTGKNFSRCVKTDKTGKFSISCLDEDNPSTCPPSKGQMKVFNEKCPKCAVTLDATKTYPYSMKVMCSPSCK